MSTRPVKIPNKKTTVRETAKKRVTKTKAGRGKGIKVKSKKVTDKRTGKVIKSKTVVKSPGYKKVTKTKAKKDNRKATKRLKKVGKAIGKAATAGAVGGAVGKVGKGKKVKYYKARLGEPLAPTPMPVMGRILPKYQTYRPKVEMTTHYPEKKK